MSDDIQDCDYAHQLFEDLPVEPLADSDTKGFSKELGQGAGDRWGTENRL
jgi:hypothetical protein